MAMQNLEDLGETQKSPTTLLIDSQSAINMTKNPIFHSNIKHVNTKYHFIKSLIKPQLCPSEDQTSDIFTKPLGRINFTKFIDELGLCKNELLD
jgi:hypothetical protein